MLNLHEFAENINKTGFKGAVLKDEPLSERTTMQVGGSAALLLEPRDKASLVLAAAECFRRNIEFFILGGGSNVVFGDEGFRGAVISTRSLDSIEVVEDGEFSILRCGAGAKTDDAVKFCAERGIAGIETFAGLPGTVGGAARMNARCYGSDFSSAIQSVSYVNLKEISENSSNFLERAIKIYHNRNNCDWGYKRSPFQGREFVILELTLRCQKADSLKAPALLAECRKFVDDRTQKGHFKFPSSGSVFKNDRNFGAPSGKLIDDAGLKGTRAGGAQIAPWHGNFIINTGNARAADIQSLVTLAQERVKERSGFQLEPEIIFV